MGGGGGVQGCVEGRGIEGVGVCGGVRYGGCRVCEGVRWGM